MHRCSTPYVNLCAAGYDKNPLDRGDNWKMFELWLGDTDRLVHRDMVMVALDTANDSSFGFGAIERMQDPQEVMET
jgi:hypothetical protein